MNKLLAVNIVKSLISLNLFFPVSFTSSVNANSFDNSIVNKFDAEDSKLLLKAENNDNLCKGDYYLDGYSCISLDLSTVNIDGNNPFNTIYFDSELITILENNNKVFAYVYQDSDVRKYDLISMSTSIDDDLLNNEGDVGFGYIEHFNDYDLRLVSVSSNGNYYKYEILNYKTEIGRFRRYLIRELYSKKNDLILPVSKEFAIDQTSTSINTRVANSITIEDGKLVGFYYLNNAEEEQHYANHFVAFNTEYDDSQYGELVGIDIISQEDYYKGVFGSSRIALRDYHLYVPAGTEVGCSLPWQSGADTTAKYNPFNPTGQMGVCSPFKGHNDLYSISRYKDHTSEKPYYTIDSGLFKSVKNKIFSVKKKSVKVVSSTFFGIPISQYEFDTIQLISELENEQKGPDFEQVDNYKYLVTFNQIPINFERINDPGPLSDITSTWTGDTYKFNIDYAVKNSVFTEQNPWIEYNQVSIISLTYRSDKGEKRYVAIDGYDDSMGLVQFIKPTETEEAWWMQLIAVICAILILIIFFAVLCFCFPVVWTTFLSVFKVVFKVLILLIKYFSKFIYYLLKLIIYIPYLIFVLPFQAIDAKRKGYKLKIWNPFKL